MRKLIEGIVEFQNNLNTEARRLFAKLALGQQPDALFITCSDSRVVPDLLASTNPGDLFVLRNVGNLVPPFEPNLRDRSIAAAIEFSLSSLNVSNIIVCGHSQCGAMDAIENRYEEISCPHLSSWLKYGDKAWHKVKEGRILNHSHTTSDQISQINVLEQMENLMTYPLVKERVRDHHLEIHGWWFDIPHAHVYCYEKNVDQFILINQEEAKVILDRLASLE